MPLGALAGIATDLRDIPREVRKQISPAIREAAAPALTLARTNAAWSNRIPPAMRIKPLYGRKRSGVLLVVSAKRAPHARPYEGITGRTFRAPLFGDRDRWYAHRARPYAWPAVLATREQVGRAVAEVVDDVCRQHGFH